MKRSKMRYCGREFTASQIDWIRRHSASSGLNRAQLSRLVCRRLGWYKPDGGLKEMSCRVAMLRMQDDGLLALPAPLGGNGNGKRYSRRTAAAEPGSPRTCRVDQLSGLRLELVTGQRHSQLWNEYVDRYHYLGFAPLPGAQLRYFACADDQHLALLGFGAAAWKILPRDRWIGWSHPQREQRLHLLVNNARFLILPWIDCANLASKLLGMVARRLADDWQASYGYRPVLLETFVESGRFAGTSYRSANWIHVGRTQGRGKLDRHHTRAVPPKEIWLYPLRKDFRNILRTVTSQK